MILKREFYERDPLMVAKELLGKTLVHEAVEGVTSGIIVETEAYQGPEDKASHAYGNLRTNRTEIQFGPKGHAYIYLVYGMHYCLNVTVGRVAGKPEAVLLRALEPLEGIEIMKKRRQTAKRKLCLKSGPGRLCAAMGLSKSQNGMVLTSPPLYIRSAKGIPQEGIVETTRIGVDYAEEWKNTLWRFKLKKTRSFQLKLRNKTLFEANLPTMEASTYKF